MAELEVELITPNSRPRTGEAATLQARALTGYKDYSAERKAEVLALVTANGGNVARVAKETGIAHQTIFNWLKQAQRYSHLEQRKQTELAQKLENNAHMLADSIADHDLSIVPLASKATALGIMVDKMQLLRGEPTSITANVDRQELSVTLNSALGELDQADPTRTIDVTPEPGP